MLQEVINWAIGTVIIYTVTMGTGFLTYMLFQDLVERRKK
jgi:hypothetical protein